MSIQAAHKVRMNLDALTYAQKVWEAMDTAVSLSCAILLREGEHKQLVSKTVNSLSYVDPFDFFRDYQAVKLLSKYPYLNTGINTQEVAKEKFDWAEDLCKRTNVRWRMRESGHLFEARVESVISRALRKISHILGDVPALERMDFSFGPGAAYGVRGETSVFNKVTSALECTYAFVDKLQEFLEEFPGWIPEGVHDVRVVPGSQLAFVPKDAKTDRPICIEPLLNGLYQKGVGTYLRKRLKSFGINLDDQSVNQKLAEKAFRCHLATVDFSSASDTIAYRIVLDLLPIDWFQFLEVARCPRYQYRGEWSNFQKFTSMGNAYTFELETLIFYALAYACCEELGLEVRTGENLSVYGDDVIIPQSAFDLFSEVAIACGFALNHEKSYSSGPFYESCGHDYFLGTLVRPFLIKKRLNKLLPAFYASNVIRRLQSRLPAVSGIHSRDSRNSVLHRLDGVHAWVVGRIPRDFRVVGPEGYGDGHLIGELDEAVTSRPSRVSRHRQYDGWWFRTYAESPIRVNPGEWPIAYALYFTRASKDEERPEFKLPSLLDGIREPLDNGSGYAVRGKTRLTRLRVLCHGTWHGYKQDYWISDYPVPREIWGDSVERA